MLIKQGNLLCQGNEFNWRCPREEHSISVGLSERINGGIECHTFVEGHYPVLADGIEVT